MPFTFEMEDSSGQPVPTVDPDTLRRMWNVAHDARTTLGNDGLGDSQTLGIDAAIIAKLAGTSSPVAVWLRSSLVEFMYKQDLLGPWLEADQPNESVFRLAAAWPLPSIRQFDVGDFLQKLSNSGG